MRACLIEAAKLAGPAFKNKAPEQPEDGAGGSGSLAGLGPSPLSFEISVDAGRGPPAPAPSAMAAFEAAVVAGTGEAAALPAMPTAESDQLLLMTGGPPMGSDRLLPMPPPLPAPPLLGAQQPGGAPVAPAPAAALGDGPQQLLDLIRCGGGLGVEG